MSSVDVEKRRFSLATMFLRHLVDSEWARVRRPQEMRDGREWDVLRCVRDGAVVELLLDPADGACGFLRLRAKGEESVVALSDWRHIGGVRFAFESAAADGTKKTVTKAVELGVDVASATFARPSAKARVEFGGEGWMPLDLNEVGHMFVRGKLGGLDTDIVIDSGAGITVIDRRVADRAGLVGSDTVGTTGIGGTVDAEVVHDIDVTVGPIVVRGVTAAVVDLSEIERHLGRPMPLILGRSLFANAIVDIDYPNARVAFRDPAKFEYDGPGSTVPLRSTDSGLKLVECLVEGGTPGWYQIDTGSGDTVDVFKEFTTKHGLLEGRMPRSTKLDGGVGGFAPAIIATARSFTFAGYELQNMPLSFSRAEEGAFAKQDHDGNLGAGIFDRFRLLIDFGRDQMHIEPTEDWRTRPFRRERLGVAAAPAADGQSLEILHIAEGSPAEKAGLKPGDRITAIDGEGGGSVSMVRRLRALRLGEVGQTVALTVGEGREQRLVLADYY